MMTPRKKENADSTGMHFAITRAALGKVIAECLPFVKQNDTEYYRDFIARKQAEYGDRFDPSGLDPRYIPYFHSDVRIKVETGDGGMVLTGTVGVTTGWKPSFLLMRTARSHGSSWLLGKDERIVGVKQGRSYVAPSNGR